jgi:hypothetical protein
VPAWQKPSTATLESAAADNRPLVIYFAKENATDADFADAELAEISKTDAVFIQIPYTADREASPWAEKTVVPTSKILSENPSREYDVRVGQMTIIVADSHGNEYYRMTKAPSGSQLQGYIKKIQDQVEKANKKLEKNLDKAREYLDGDDRKNALKYLLKNFKEGMVGLEAQEESIRMYHNILDAARTEMAELKEKGDAEGLKNLKKDLSKTDLEDDIDEALKEIK